MGRIALIGENSIGYVDKLIDIWNEGNCAVLLDWRIPFQTSLEMMIEAGVRQCFIDKDLLNKIDKYTQNTINFIAYDKRNNSVDILPDCFYDKFQNNYSKEEAIVVYSSGTTGKSKGVILSHFAINNNADAIIDYMNPNPDDCIYIAKSLSHSSTITGELLVALKSRMKVVIAPTIVPPRYILNNINKFNVSVVCLNPILLLMIADECEKHHYCLSSLKTIYVSGSILNDKIYNKACRVFTSAKVYNVYGLSEAGPRVTAQNHCSGNSSVGKPIKGVEISIVNEQGKKISDGEYGIIHIKTPSIFDGYIIGDRKLKPLRKGWHNTGDIGYIDAAGELHIVGRADDVIIIDSHKIYPNDVERQIIELADIKTCSVVKVEIDGDECIGCLYVSENNIDSDIKLKLKNQLMIYEIPKFFLRCNVLPTSINGKVSVRNVQEYIKKYKSEMNILKWK